MTPLTDMLAFLQANQAPANEGTRCDPTTLLRKLKADVEALPKDLPELTPEQQAEQARSNALFVADHLAPGEDKHSLAKLWADFRAEWGPNGALEEELVRHVASSAWGMRRIDRIESWHWSKRVQYAYQQTTQDGAQFETYQDINMLLNDATVGSTFILQEDWERIQYFRKIMEKRFDAAIKRLLQYRKVTKSKPAKLDRTMQYENQAEHKPEPEITAALTEKYGAPKPQPKPKKL